eukprot:gene18608-20484_t
MSSDSWNQLQAHKRKQESLKERLLKRRKERQGLVLDEAVAANDSKPTSSESSPAAPINQEDISTATTSTASQKLPEREATSESITEIDKNLERRIIDLLCNTLLNLPVSTDEIKDALAKVNDPVRKVNDPVRKVNDPVRKVNDPVRKVNDPVRKVNDPVRKVNDPMRKVNDPMRKVNDPVRKVNDPERKTSKRSSDAVIKTILEKLEAQALISVKRDRSGLSVADCEYAKLEALFEDIQDKNLKTKDAQSDTRKRKKETERGSPEVSSKRPGVERRPEKASSNKNAIESLLAMPTMKEKENKKVGEEIIELLNEPTAKEISLMEKFKSQGGKSVKEFCPYGTRDECRRNNTDKEKCTKLHFKKIIQKHTDETLGDCSFLNTCFHMDTCKYVHYEVDYSACPDIGKGKSAQHASGKQNLQQIAIDRQKHVLYPPQWIQCDIRYLDFDVLGKFSVIMADPPWDIHMELPYGTMQDDEMRTLPVRRLQDDGFIFLWVTGRAMELGRECLEVWGYDSCDELIWVKTNQLQRLIRTGRTGHWINHGKEHCLVGRKGNPKDCNLGLDCDVLVSEVRDTSHKPDEIYGLIERLSPGTKKIELFGRQHNVQPNWITLGNQLPGVKLVDPDVVKKFKEKYPDGNCMKKVAKS